ncbi:hypothetical protein [Haloquadratum walsbyi]|uniref:hypothetical protein n=1 Tax=Haloquadratum walsbyi TaxID=293091 RepID=UPI0026EAAD86|nr:hypothetical protein [Haloquadratum walsbyi]
MVGSPRPSWNQLTHRRRQAYFADDEDVCDVEHDDLYDKYAPILGKAACQQVTRKNSDAWRSFFRLLDQYHSQDPSVTEKPSPPGYCGNRDDGYGYDPYGLVSPGTIYARSTGAKKKLRRSLASVTYSKTSTTSTAIIRNASQLKSASPGS